MRMVIVRINNSEVSCLQMNKSIDHYHERYNVITIIKKPWNIYFVSKIKNYFKNKGSE